MSLLHFDVYNYSKRQLVVYGAVIVGKYGHHELLVLLYHSEIIQEQNNVCKSYAHFKIYIIQEQNLLVYLCISVVL